MKMTSLIAMNLMLALVWGMIQGTQSALGYAVGYIIGFLILALVYPDYGRRTFAAAAYAGFLLWQIVLSALKVTRAILSPGDRSAPAIVAVPLRVTSPAELVILASSITLTPGTMSVETGTAPDGGRVLFVHALFGQDPDALRAEIRDEFETRILRFTRASGRGE